MPYPYPGLFAIDPLDPANVAVDAELTIFDPADMGREPIALTDSEGMPLSNPLRTNSKGFVGVFYAGLDEVGWSAAGLEGIIQSYQGIKKVALEAASSSAASEADASRSAEEAQEAKEAAVRAMNLVGAPADEAIATAVSSEGSLSRGAIQVLADKSMDRPVDPSAYLDNIEVVCKFSMYRNDGDTDERVYVQGMSINEADDELYLNYGGGSAGWQRFEVRELSTGTLLSNLKVTSENSYGQGMPWWKDEETGDLHFIAFLKAKTTTEGFYSILNYTQGTVGAPVSIRGSSHGDRYGEYFITSDADGDSSTTTLTEFYVYDWASMTSGTPELLRTIKISNPGPTPAKLQGETMIGGHFFTHGGHPSTNGGLPTICHYDSTGQLLKVYQFDVMDLVRAINTNRPGLLVERPTLNWEAEGITHSGGKLYTQHVFGHVDAETHDPFGGYIRSVVILRHNNPLGTLVPSRPATGYVRDTGWKDATYLTGYTYASAGRKLQYRVQDGRVFWRGSVKAVTGDIATGAYLQVAEAPSEAMPTQPMRFASGDTASSGFIQFEKGQNVKVYLRTAQGQISMDVPSFLND